ncbi:MAG: flagellar hook protein FlgE, partial [Pseudomonadota bacterium]
MSFNIAISGLNAAQTDLSTTANNIANASTSGFKNGRAQFSDIFTRGSASAGGAGVRVSGVKQEFGQGSIEFTGNELDLAIAGNGFFVVKERDGSTSYTRAGAFSVDSSGTVVNTTGQKLQVYLTGNNGTGGIGDLKLSKAD